MTAVASYRSDFPGCGIHFSDEMIFRIGNIDAFGTIDKNPLRFIESGFHCWPVVTRIAAVTGARNGIDYPGCGIHSSDDIIFRVGNKVESSGLSNQLKSS